LRALKAQGLDARKIGLALGTTKNAIIGKLRRLGLAASPELEPQPEPPPPPSEPIRKPQCSLFELTEDACRWPIGDPGQSGFAFCGEETAAIGLPYCPAHCLVAYNPKR
jgi:GcrA cell cycle regulator